MDPKILWLNLMGFIDQYLTGPHLGWRQMIQGIIGCQFVNYWMGRSFDTLASAKPWPNPLDYYVWVIYNKWHIQIIRQLNKEDGTKRTLPSLYSQQMLSFPKYLISHSKLLNIIIINCNLLDDIAMKKYKQILRCIFPQKTEKITQKLFSFA